MSDDPLLHPGSPRIVELLGLPGSGKSTLAAAVLHEPEPVALPPSRVSGRIRIPAGAALDRRLRRIPEILPGRAGRAVRSLLWLDRAPDFLTEIGRTHPAFLELVAHAPPPSDADPEQVLRWRTWPLTTLETHVLLRRAHAPGVTTLVEEGVVQRANTVCAGDESLAPRYFATQPLPDAVVVLQVDPDEALSRIRTRPKRTLLRHAGRSDEEVLRDLERSARLVTTAVTGLQERGVPVHVLDATEPTVSLRQQLVDRIAAPEATGRA
jgi:hypothetical protein